MDTHVDTLISMCTPNWGSGYTELSSNTGTISLAIFAIILTAFIVNILMSYYKIKSGIPNDSVSSWIDYVDANGYDYMAEVLFLTEWPIFIVSFILGSIPIKHND